MTEAIVLHSYRRHDVIAVLRIRRHFVLVVNLETIAVDFCRKFAISGIKLLFYSTSWY